jgi:uncharacterized membrane protein (DUF4010 family)
VPEGVSAVRNLAVALGIGLLIGLERERVKGSGPARAPAGIRTFALAALAGGVSLLLGVPGIFLVTAAFVAAVAVLGYVRSRAKDPGLTTEVALVVTVLLGGLAMSQPALAAGLAALVTILLAARTRLHRFVRHVLTADEVHDGLVFAAAALVVLPLAPDRALGPLGVLNPRTLWRLVVLVMAVGGAGYVAVRLLGARRGLPLSGFASGFISSAAAIGALGARARREPGLCRAAVAGAVLSTVATVVQMVIVLSATSTAVLRALTGPLVLAGLAAAGYGAFAALKSARGGGDAHPTPGRAFDLRAALLYTVTLAAILAASAGLTSWLGSRGLLLATSVAGFADAHAPAIAVASLVQSGHGTAQDAVLPILAGFTTNSVTKMVLAATAGGRAFALRTIPGLLLVVAAAWLGTLLPLPK